VAPQGPNPFPEATPQTIPGPQSRGGTPQGRRSEGCRAGGGGLGGARPPGFRHLTGMDRFGRQVEAELPLCRSKSVPADGEHVDFRVSTHYRAPPPNLEQPGRAISGQRGAQQGRAPGGRVGGPWRSPG
jgi:hypothetical protein